MGTTGVRVAKRAPAHHNLPLPPNALIGRSHELALIAESLHRTRLLTLTGPGGVGKTRMAVELARRESARRADGVWMVELAAGPELPDVAAEWARALGLRAPAGATATQALRAYLQERDLLLVFDSCEHVVDACANLAESLLTSCENVRIMATSREVLGLQGETIWRLDPLGPEYAYRLFVERARQRQPKFLATEDDEAAITNLCTRLDRLPLAIELAAARVGVMSPAEILTALEAKLVDLGSERRSAPPQQRTVRATVEWSYKVLSPPEQETFRSLAVFAGGFDGNAALSVAPTISLDVLARIVDKSLVAVVESTRGQTRYRLLETVREYAYEQLVAAGELEVAKARHLGHFVTLALEAQVGWPSRTAEVLVGRLEDDYENLRVALEWSAGSDPCAGLRLLAGTMDLFLMLGQADGLRLAELLLERCPKPDRHSAEVQILAGTLHMLVGDSPAAKAALGKARRLCEKLGERTLEGWTLLFRGLTEALDSNVELAQVDLEAGRAIHRQCGEGMGEARATAALGLTLLNSGDRVRAREVVEDALAICTAEDDRWGQGSCHLYLGFIAGSAGTEPTRATHHFRQAVELLRPYQGGPLLPAALVGQAGVVARRDLAKALQIIAAATAIRARAGGKFPPVYRTRADRVRSAAEAALGVEAARVWAEGARLSLDEVVPLAFGTERPRRIQPAGLSERELEVARLVAQGLPNKAIATRLHLSVRTVESHVRNSLGKVGIENRTQLATWARQRIQ